MRKKIFNYVKERPKYQLEEESRKTGLKGKISRSEEMWKHISMNHITKLSRSKWNDSILIIQDQFTEMIYLSKTIPEKENAEKVWQDYWDTAWKLHSILQEIRIDQRTIFTSKRWKDKYKIEEIGYVKTTVYHSQTNRQVEYVNRKIKRYLQKYISYHQDNWTELLTMLEYTYNTRKADEKTFILFQIIYKKYRWSLWKRTYVRFISRRKKTMNWEKR